MSKFQEIKNKPPIISLYEVHYNREREREREPVKAPLFRFGGNARVGGEKEFILPSSKTFPQKINSLPPKSNFSLFLHIFSSLFPSVGEKEKESRPPKE